METSKNPSEFRASIISYDTSDDPYRPILASSGDNINLIFNIPKESFRKLAIAAIAHLDSNSEHDSPSKGSEETDNRKQNRSNKTHFRLSDEVKNLESENTSEIIKSFAEDCNTSKSSKNNPILNDSNLFINGGDNVVEAGGASVPNDYETEIATSSAENEGNQSVLPDLDLSDYLEMENAWPDIKSFVPTEKIQIEELKSGVSNKPDGLVTKFLKMVVSNEFVVIKVISESNVRVDAVKYKEKGRKSALKTEEELDDSMSDEKAASEMLDLDSLHKTKGKIEALDENSPGSPQRDSSFFPDILSPMERLKLALKESLKKFSSEIGEEKQTEVSLNTSSTSSENFDAQENASESEHIQIKRKSLEHSLVTDSSEIAYSNEMTVQCHENNSDNESNAEQESLKVCSKHYSMLSETGLSYNSTNKDESANLNDSIATENLALNDKNFKSENSLCCAEETNTEKSFSKTTEEKNLFEDSALGKDLNLSENEVVNDCSKLEDIECKEVGLQEMSQSIPCEIVESENVETNYDEIPDNDANHTSKNDHDMPNEQCEQAVVEENCCRREMVKNRKLENFEKSFTKGSVEEQNISENPLSDKTNAENGYETKNEKFKSESNEEFEGVKKTIKTGNAPEIFTYDTNVEATTNEASDVNKNSESLENSLSSIIAEEQDCSENKSTNDKFCTENSFEINNEGLNSELIAEFKAITDEESSRIEKDVERHLDEFKNILIESLAKDGSENVSTDDKCYDERFCSESSEESKDVEKLMKTENTSEIFITDKNVKVTSTEECDVESNERHLKTLEKEDPNSMYLEDSVSESTDVEEKQTGNISSNMESFIDTTVDSNVESTSECGDMESDDVKSVASESDDKDDYKQSSIRRNLYRNNKADEVDCAPTRTRRKAIPELSKDAIPENAELKSTKIRASALDTPSKSSEKTSPKSRSLRSKSLDPMPQPSEGKLPNKKWSSIESQESTRRTRAKTPDTTGMKDIIGMKDIKTTARSSPRKYSKASAAAESHLTSNAQNSKTSSDDSKSRAKANLDSSMSTKRGKRSNKQ